MKNDAIRRYCRAVGRQLELPGAQRKKLLSGLRQDLEDCHSAQRNDWQALCAELGEPVETAETLMESVSPERRAAYRSGRKKRTVAVIALMAMLLILLGGLFSHLATTQVVRAERHITDLGTTYVTEGAAENAP